MNILIGKSVEGKKLVHDKEKQAQVEIPDGWLTIQVSCVEDEVKATGEIKIRKGDGIVSVAQGFFRDKFAKLSQKAVTAEVQNA